MHGNKEFENVSDCVNANVTLTTFLDHIYIYIYKCYWWTCPRPSSLYQLVISYCQYISLI